MKIVAMFHKWYEKGEKPSGLLAVAFKETEKTFEVAKQVYKYDQSETGAKFFGTIAGICFSRREYYYDLPFLGEEQ